MQRPVKRIDWQQQPTIRIKQSARNIQPQQQRTHLESANEFLCLSLKYCVFPAAQSQHSSAGRNSMPISTPVAQAGCSSKQETLDCWQKSLAYFHRHRDFPLPLHGQCVSKTRLRTPKCWEKSYFLTAPNSTSSHSFPARLAHLTYKNSDSFPIPEHRT